MAASGTAKLTAFLLADATVTALVGTEIHTPRLPHAIEFPSIVFRVQGGPGAGRDPGRAQSFQFRFYADTALAAVTLYETTRTALLPLSTNQEPNRVAMRAAGLVLAEEEIEGQLLYDPDATDKGAAYVLGNFTVVFHDA